MPIFASVDVGADRLCGGGMRPKLVVGNSNGGRPVPQPGRMDAVGMAEEGEDRRLVERHPVLDTVAEA